VDSSVSTKTQVATDRSKARGGSSTLRATCHPEPKNAVPRTPQKSRNWRKKSPSRRGSGKPNSAGVDPMQHGSIRPVPQLVPRVLGASPTERQSLRRPASRASLNGIGATGFEPATARPPAGACTCAMRLGASPPSPASPATETSDSSDASIGTKAVPRAKFRFAWNVMTERPFASK